MPNMLVIGADQLNMLLNKYNNDAARLLCDVGWSDVDLILVLVLSGKIGKENIRKCMDDGFIPEHTIKWLMRNLGVWPTKKVYTNLTSITKKEIKRKNPLLSTLYERDFMNLLP